jgi:hypothetical protein
MSEDKGKRRGTRPAEPTVPEEATLPVDAADGIQAASLVPAVGDIVDPRTLQRVDVPVLTELQGVNDPSSMFTGLSGDGSPLGQLADVMPTFGNVLLSIGSGVAASQQAIDRSLIETVKTLQDTKITVVTDVIQELGDDGLPDVENPPTVETQEVSLINYVPPTHHLFKSVKISMDMSVSGLSSEHGLVFNQKQSTAAGSSGSSWWGFYGWFDGYGSASRQEQTQVSQSEQQWSSGQVRLDASLGARRMEKLPVGAQVAIGPQISFSVGAAREATSGAISQRWVEVTVQVRKSSGAVNPEQDLDVACDPFPYAFMPGYGNATDAQGRTVVKVYRDYPKGLAPAPGKARLTVTLGAIVRTFEVTL